MEHICLSNDRLLLAVPAQCPVCAGAQRQGKIDLGLFRNEPFILLRSGQAIRNITDKIFSDYNIKPIVAYETRSFDIAYRMAKENLGCTFVTSSVRHLSHEILFYDLDQGVYSYPLLLAYRKNIYLSSPMKQFIALAKELGKNLQLLAAPDMSY